MVYAILKSLSGLELIDGEWDNSTYPPRAVYATTPEGEATFQRWLRQPVERLRQVRHDFMVKLYFALEEGPGKAAELIERQIEACKAYERGVEAGIGEADESSFDAIALQSRVVAVRGTLQWLRASQRSLKASVGADGGVMGRYGKRATLVLLLTIAGVLVACGGGDSRTAESSGPTGKITVFAAASLTEAFKEIATKFEATFQGTKVDFNFAGTPTLRTQLEQGARADVFASANREQMALAQASGVVEPSSRTFARNSLVIITPVENRASVESVEDLGRDGLKLVLALEAVPVGAYTHQALTAMSVEAGYGQGFGEAVMSHGFRWRATSSRSWRRSSLARRMQGSSTGPTLRRSSHQN